MFKKKKAFTMLELIFVIVVLGILAALALPRLDRDTRQEAGDTILAAIRYTQHLALTDNKYQTDNNFQPTADWQSGYWAIRFSQTGGEWRYEIGSNTDGGANFDQDEIAMDPTSGKYLYSSDATKDADESENIFITDKYGINGVDFATSCNPVTGTAGTNNSRHVAFDYFGRPHKGVFPGGNDYGTVMQGNCTITFSFADGSPDLSITIEKGTGRASIDGQPYS